MTKEFAILAILVIPGAVFCAVIDVWRERRAFKRWLREGRWKFEKFKH